MAYELIKEDGNKRVVQFTMEAADLKKIFRKVKKDIAKEVNIKGFRPGHVPASIIEKRFGNIIIAEVAENAHKQLANGLFDEFDWILSDTDQETESSLPVEGEDFTYSVTYHIFETPEPVDYKEMKLVLPFYSPEKAVQDTIEHIRSEFATFEKTEEASVKGDSVTLLYANPDADENSELKEIVSVIGKNDMGPGFDELITGVKAGESFTMQISLEKEGETSLQGPTHSITVEEVRAHSLPALDDEFAAKTGEFKTMEELTQKLTEDIVTRFDSEKKSFSERQMIDNLLKSNSFEVPKFMVKNLLKEYISSLEDEDPEEETLKAAEEMAENKVREFLILREIAIRENLEIKEDEMNQAITDGDSKSSYLDRNRNDLALDFILSSAVIENKDPKEHESEATTIPWKWVAVDPAQIKVENEVKEEEEAEAEAEEVSSEGDK